LGFCVGGDMEALRWRCVYVGHGSKQVSLRVQQKMEL